MPCPERLRLLKLYSEATRNFFELVAVLKDVAISYEIDAFNRAWEHSEAARRQCADIKEQIYSHVDEHQCALVLALPEIRKSKSRAR